MNAMVIILVIVAILVILGIAVWVMYNSLVTLRVRVEEAWSDIDIQLKRRVDLIPNLINSVKGYAAHEKDVLNSVTEARNALMNANNVKDNAQAEGMLDGALKNLFAVAESYPDLKANQNFLQLQQELVDTEDKIQAARRFYNAGVTNLNTKIETFPSNIVAGMFKFEKREFFEVADRSKIEEPVEVKF